MCGDKKLRYEKGEEIEESDIEHDLRIYQEEREE